MNPYSLELYTYLAPSKICSGVGVFALIEIPKDTIIWKIREELTYRYLEEEKDWL